MALTDDGNMIMPVAPTGGGFGGGGFGNDWGWIILLLLFAGGGWGGFGGGNEIYPWMNQADITTSGFQNAATNTAISSLQNGVTSGFGDVHYYSLKYHETVKNECVYSYWREYTYLHFLDVF